MQKTLVILKPDAIQRRLMGKIIDRFEQKSLKVVAMKFKQLDIPTLQKHYGEHLGKPFYPALEKFMSFSPVLLMVLEGPEAISVVRSMMGPTDSTEAPSGTIRGDYSLSKRYNLVHGSDSEESAGREIAIFFDSSELVSYNILEFDSE